MQRHIWNIVLVQQEFDLRAAQNDSGISTTVTVKVSRQPGKEVPRGVVEDFEAQLVTDDVVATLSIFLPGRHHHFEAVQSQALSNPGTLAHGGLGPQQSNAFFLG
eukprot:Skav207475  [mRNA]  locus=scaffold5111:35916:39498:- [translate_table: standard]